MGFDAETLNIFIQSCMEQLEDIETQILRSENAPPEEMSKALAGVFRAAHSIKADAGSLGYSSMVALCHQLEEVIELAQEGRVALAGAGATALLSGFDALKQMIAAAGKDEQPDTTAEIASLKQFMANADSPAPAEGSAPDNTNDSSRNGVVEQAARAQVSVPAESLERLVDDVGELAVLSARVNGLAKRLNEQEGYRTAEELERVGLSIRERVLGMRMLPLKVCFNGLPRVVRDESAAANKRIELTITGQETRMDKTAVDGLKSPLIHLVRNAARHGVETTAERELAGKPESGKIAIHAKQVGNEVLITVADDGRGINTQRLFEKAVAAGMLSQNAQLSDKELLDLVFRPGLSTSDVKDETSGRGVGMDAVLNSLQGLRGAVTVESTPGQGATITLRAPLSLAVMDCLHVTVGGEDFLLHFDNVQECLEKEATLCTSGAEVQAVEIRGEMTPVVCLAAFFQLKRTVCDRTEVAVVQVFGERFGLAVDEIKGLRQAVFKKISVVGRVLEGVMGAAVMDDGAMALIIDLPGLYRVIQELGRQESETPGRAP